MKSDPAASTLSIAAYARVCAGVAEGFALEEVLAAERLPKEAWTRGDAGWKQRLADEPASFSEYVRELAAAEDALARSVKPVDTDLGAWLSLLEGYAANASSLQDLGLRMNDLARLQRLWARRAGEDASLDARVAELRKRPLPPLPPLELGVARLPGAAAQPGHLAVASATADRAVAFEGMDLAGFARLTAELVERPRDQVLSARGLDEAGLARVESAFRAAFARRPEAERDFSALVSHERQRVRAASRALEEAIEPVAPPRADVVTPGMASDGTLELRGSGAGITLPFVRSALGPERASGPRASPLAPRPHPSGEDATIEANDVARGDPLPFGGAPEGGHEGTVGASVPRDPAITLPFQPGASPLAAGHDRPLAPSRDGATIEAPSGDAVKDALPFVGHGDASDGRLAAPTALTLERHASLAAELSLGAAEADVLARYRVSAVERAALDAHYGELTARDPRARAAWRDAFRKYLAYLKGRDT